MTDPKPRSVAIIKVQSKLAPHMIQLYREVSALGDCEDFQSASVSVYRVKGKLEDLKAECLKIELGLMEVLNGVTYRKTNQSSG